MSDVISYYVRTGQQPVYFTIYYVKVVLFIFLCNVYFEGEKSTIYTFLPKDVKTNAFGILVFKIVCSPLDHIHQHDKGPCGRRVSYPSRNGVS